MIMNGWRTIIIRGREVKCMLDTIRHKHKTLVSNFEGKYPIDAATAVLSCNDWLTTVNLYKDDPQALIFLDPPYMSSNTEAEKSMPEFEEDNYLIIQELFKSAKAQIIMIVNNSLLMRFLFSDLIVHTYKKDYLSVQNHIMPDGSTVKVRNQAEHLLIMNRQVAPTFDFFD